MAHRSAAVLVPVKAFDQAKHRLAPALDAHQRADLARSMATNVVTVAAPLPVWVVCDDDEVADWAAGTGATVLWRPGRGLNAAVADGVDHLAGLAFDQVIVAHADLPHAVDLAWVADFDGVTLVPDRHDDGTNVACVPTGVRVHLRLRRPVLRPPPGRGAAPGPGPARRARASPGLGRRPARRPGHPRAG